MAAKRTWTHPRIDPKRIDGELGLVDLVDGTFLAYNAARLREACQLFTRKMLDDDVTVGASVSGTLVPAGVGTSALLPLVERGFLDWIITTGANLYHDVQISLGLGFESTNPEGEIPAGVVRLYDLACPLGDFEKVDAFLEQVLQNDEFHRPMGSAEFHHRLGRHVAERERSHGGRRRSLLAAAWEHAVPIYTPSPGDSAIGLAIAGRALQDRSILLDPSLDVNETAAIVFDAKRRGGRSAVLLLGGGSPKNFMLQTEPQIQEVLGLTEKGHDYFLQVTDARPDTGGLSGATPGEAVSWGKIDPERLPDSVVCYTDLTVALPILTAYALTAHAPRTTRRLYDRREELLGRLRDESARIRKAR